MTIRNVECCARPTKWSFTAKERHLISIWKNAMIERNPEGVVFWCCDTHEHLALTLGEQAVNSKSYKNTTSRHATQVGLTSTSRNFCDFFGFLRALKEPYSRWLLTSDCWIWVGTKRAAAQRTPHGHKNTLTIGYGAHQWSSGSRAQGMKKYSNLFCVRGTAEAALTDSQAPCPHGNSAVICALPLRSL